MQQGPSVATWFQDGSFGNTDWCVVRHATTKNQSEGGPARARLCADYWKPVYKHIRRLGYGPEDAEDLTQEFFARILKKNSLRSATKEKGKFRSFLVTLLKRFLADERDRARSQKRGAGRLAISLDSSDTEFRRRYEPVDHLNPEIICERNWAQTLFEDALGQLHAECLSRGTADLLIALKPMLLCETNETYAAVARALSLSESKVKVTIHRLRRRLRCLLRLSIERSGTPDSQVENEFRDLYSILAA